MITIISNPRPFQGIFDTIQRNSIKSWLLLRPKCEIILFDDEEGTSSKVAKSFGIKCITKFKTNEFGTPLLNDVFTRAQKAARNEIIAQVNIDIILMNDFLKTIVRLSEMGPFYMIGQRWNLDIDQPINFKDPNWEKKIRKKIVREGKLHPKTGIDYWVFPRDTDYKMPAFAVGRPAADSWLVYKNKTMGIPVIDTTEVVTIVHQNHPRKTKSDKSYVIEVKRNQQLAKHFFTIGDADWRLTKNGLRKNKMGMFDFIRYLAKTPELLPGNQKIWLIPHRIAYRLYKIISRFRKQQI